MKLAEADDITRGLQDVYTEFEALQTIVSENSMAFGQLDKSGYTVGERMGQLGRMIQDGESPGGSDARRGGRPCPCRSATPGKRRPS